MGICRQKDRNVKLSDDSIVGSVWTFCALDAETKLVPAFRVGQRNAATANAFVADVAERVKNRVQISTDGFKAYVQAVEKAFGNDVDYAQIVKVYGHDAGPDHRYSTMEVIGTEKYPLIATPD